MTQLSFASSMLRDGQIVRMRLKEAGLELFTERGYERTTTERTYFRHFTDKREVRFASELELQDVTIDKINAVPENLEPLLALPCGFHAVVPLIEKSCPSLSFSRR